MGLMVFSMDSSCRTVRYHSFILINGAQLWSTQHLQHDSTHSEYAHNQSRPPLRSAVIESCTVRVTIDLSQSATRDQDRSMIEHVATSVRAASGTILFHFLRLYQDLGSGDDCVRPTPDMFSERTSLDETSPSHDE